MSSAKDPNSPEEKKLQRIELERECRMYIADCEWQISQLENEPDLAIEIKVGEITVGLTDGEQYTKQVIALLKYQIAEAKKCLAGKENGYE